MTPKTAGQDESNLAKNPAIDLLKALGYSHAPPKATNENPHTSSRCHGLWDSRAAPRMAMIMCF